jgi:hypothetical protein
MTTDIRTILDFVLADRLRFICERTGVPSGGSRAEQRDRVVRAVGGNVRGLITLLMRAEIVEFLATRDLGGSYAELRRASRWELEQLLVMLCTSDPRATQEKPLGNASPVRFERRVARPKRPPEPVRPPPPPPEWEGRQTASSTSQKVFSSRVQRQRGLVYYVKDGDIWAAPSRHGEGKRAPHLVHEAGVPMDHVTYLYYVDGDGDIARKRRDGAPLTGTTRTVDPGPVRVFIGYARSDRQFLNELYSALSFYEVSGELSIFFDTRAEPGTVWEPALMSKLEQAEIAILLVSNGFLSSRYCYQVELPIIRERHRRGECELAPVLVRQCLFEQSAVGVYQIIRPNNQAVDDHERRDPAWREVALALTALMARARAKRR